MVSEMAMNVPVLPAPSRQCTQIGPVEPNCCFVWCTWRTKSTNFSELWGTSLAPGELNLESCQSMNWNCRIVREWRACSKSLYCPIQGNPHLIRDFKLAQPVMGHVKFRYEVNSEAIVVFRITRTWPIFVEFVARIGWLSYQHGHNG